MSIGHTLKKHSCPHAILFHVHRPYTFPSVGSNSAPFNSLDWIYGGVEENTTVKNENTELFELLDEDYEDDNFEYETKQ